MENYTVIFCWQLVGNMGGVENLIEHTCKINLKKQKYDNLSRLNKI
jgi:hypothetical protein